MRKKAGRALSASVAAVCLLTSVDFSGMGSVLAAGQPSADVPWTTTRYELEDGRTFTGTGTTQDIAIKTGNRFSGGRAIDTMDKNGDGAGVAIEPTVTENGLYQVVLGYSKGRAYAEGKIALYKNDTRIDYFETKTTGTDPGVEPVVQSDAIAVRLEDGDELSLRSDTGDATDAVACFDYLDISLWGGRYEAENGEFTLDSMEAEAVENASGGMAVDGFEKTDGAGVEFPFTIPADDTYYLTLGYTRINYEIADQIGVYVDGERAGEITLKSGGNTGDYIESDPVEMQLAEGSKITVKTSESDGDQGLLMMDYLKIQPKTTRVAQDSDPAFASKILRVMAGDEITVPVKNVAEGTALSYESSAPEVASVDAASGKITAAAAGEAVITATAGEITFTCKIQVVDAEEELAVPVSSYEAEEGELIAGDKADPVIKSGSTFSGGKWVEIYDAGTGAAVKITPDIQEQGEYSLTMRYAKGSMYPNDSVSVYVNSQKVGDFYMDSGSLTATRNTNTIVTELKPGDVVMVRKDNGQNSLFRYDYLMVSPVTTVPVRGLTMDEEQVTVADQETYQVKYTLSPEYATDDLVWSSDNTDVAEADGGMIWARGEGEAVITAKSIYNDAIQAQMKVTVVPNDKMESIASADMEVRIDKTYPRVMEYRMTGSGNTMDGNSQPMDTIRINGTDYKPEVTFEKTAGDTAVYTVYVNKERMASIKVDCGGETVENYTTKSILEQYDAYDSKAGTYMLRMRVVFKVPEGEDSATIRLCAAEGEGKVRFDNVRVYDTTTPEAPEDAENVVFYQDFEYGKRTDPEVRAENKATYESYYPFNLGSAGGIREARAMLQSRHDPYTQNNKNAGWDPATIMVDMALDGDHSLSVITDSLGAAFQTTPQTIRFENGHTYRISFIYQNALDDTFAFVLGADQNSEPIYQESLKATPAKTGNKTFTYEFTSISDQTWFSINRVNRDVVVSENPNPFVIDNILVEDLTEEVEPSVDKSGLEALYDQYKDLDKSGYTKETWEAFADALKAAEKVLKDEEADQDQVDAAKEELQTAADGLRVSKSNLEYWLNSAKTHVANGDTAGLVESVQQLFDDAIAQGEAVMAMENPTKDEVFNTTLKLMLAVQALDMKAGDKTDLEMALELADMIDPDKYTEDGQEIFLAAKEAAEAVMADGDAMQADVDSAWSALVDAMSALRLKADKAALEDLLDSVAGLDLSQYTEESAQAFSTALAAANAVLADITLTADDQQKVDDAVQTLAAAKEALVLKDDASAGNEGGSQEPGSGDSNTGDGSGSSESGNNAGGNNADTNAGGSSNGNSAKAAKTGDTAPVGAMLAVMVLAVVLAGGAKVLRRR